MEKSVSQLNWQKYGFYIVLITVGVTMVILNLLTPVLFDDCGYAFGLNGRIQSLNDIFLNQIEHYHTTNGRFISHSIVQLFLGIIGKSIFSILNSIVFVLFVIKLYEYIYGKVFNQVFCLLLLISVVWFLLPDQYLTFLMVAGSLNYLWATVLVMFYIQFFDRISNSNKSVSIYSLLLFFIFSFFVGGFVEMYSVALFPAFVVDLIVRKRKLNPKILISLIGFAAGAVFLVLAPGNFVRLSKVSELSYDNSLWNKIENFIYLLIINRYILVYIAIIVILFFSKRKKDFFSENLFFFLVIFFSTGFIFVSGAWWNRTFYPVLIFSTLVFLRFLRQFNFHTQLKKLGVAVLTILLLVSMVSEVNCAIKNKSIVENIIIQSKKHHIIRLNDSFCSSKMGYDNGILSASSENWRNVLFSNFYNIDSISLLSAPIYDSVYLSSGVFRNENMIFEGVYSISEVDYYLLPVNAPVSLAVAKFRTDSYIQLKPKFETLIGSNSALGKIILESDSRYVDWMKFQYTGTDQRVIVPNDQYDNMLIVKSVNDQHVLLIRKDQLPVKLLKEITFQ
jgi:hypothetical protein